MAGAVKSVEHFTLTISSGDRVDNTANVGELGLSQTLANCVPFVTRRVSTVSGGEVEDYQVDAYFSSSPSDRVIVERDDTSGAVVVEIAVVEFDSARVNVYGGGGGAAGEDMAAGREGKWTLTSSSGFTKTIDLSAYPGGAISVDLAKTFLVFHSFQNSGASTNWDTHLFRGRITGTQEVTLDRGASGGTADGHWWLIESTAGDFTVETSDVQLASVSSNTDTVTAASGDLDEMFLIGSWKGSDSGDVAEDDNTIYTVDAALTANTVTVSRAGTTDTIDWSGFLVKMADGTSVQRDSISASDGSDDVTITSVTVANSTAIISGNMGSTCGGSFSGTTGTDVPNAHVALTFVGSPTSTTLRAEHSTSGTAVGDISVEVIEWGDGGGAPATRRIMVIS